MGTASVKSSGPSGKYRTFTRGDTHKDAPKSAPPRISADGKVTYSPSTPGAKAGQQVGAGVVKSTGGGSSGDNRIAAVTPQNQVATGQGLESGVFVGNRGEQVIVKEGPRAKTAGELVRAVREGNYQPVVAQRLPTNETRAAYLARTKNANYQNSDGKIYKVTNEPNASYGTSESRSIRSSSVLADSSRAAVLRGQVSEEKVRKSYLRRVAESYGKTALNLAASTTRGFSKAAEYNPTSSSFIPARQLAYKPFGIAATPQVAPANLYRDPDVQTFVIAGATAPLAVAAPTITAGASATVGAYKYLKNPSPEQAGESLFYATPSLMQGGRSASLKINSFSVSRSVQGESLPAVLGDRRIATPPGKAVSTEIRVRPIERDVYRVASRDVGGSFKTTEVRGRRVLGEEMFVRGEQLGKASDQYFVRITGERVRTLGVSSQGTQALSSSLGNLQREEIAQFGLTTLGKISKNAPRSNSFRVEKSLLPPGGTENRAGIFELSYEQAQLSKNREIVPTMGRNPGRTAPARQIRYTPGQVATSYRSPRQVEALRPFNEGAGDAFAIDTNTGRFSLLRYTEARPFNRGTGRIPGRPTMSTGTLPESGATQRNLPKELAKAFIDTVRGRKVLGVPQGFSKPLVVTKVIFTPKRNTFGALEATTDATSATGLSSTLLLEPPSTESTTTTTTGSETMLEPPKQEQKNEQATKQTIKNAQKQQERFRKEQFSKIQEKQKAIIIPERKLSTAPERIASAALSGGRFRRGSIVSARVSAVSSSRARSRASNAVISVSAVDSLQRFGRAVDQVGRQATISRLATESLVSQRSRASYSVALLSRSPLVRTTGAGRPRVIIPELPDFPKLPKSGSSSSKTLSRRGGERRYTPSLYAVGGNIRGSPSKGSVVTGLGVRPLPSSSKKKGGRK